MWTQRHSWVVTSHSSEVHKVTSHEADWHKGTGYQPHIESECTGAIASNKESGLETQPALFETDDVSSRPGGELATDFYSVEFLRTVGYLMPSCSRYVLYSSDRSNTSSSPAGTSPSSPCSARSPACPSGRRNGLYFVVLRLHVVEVVPRLRRPARAAAGCRASSSPAPSRRRSRPCARSASPSRSRSPSCGPGRAGCSPDSCSVTVGTFHEMSPMSSEPPPALLPRPGSLRGRAAASTFVGSPTAGTFSSCCSALRQRLIVLGPRRQSRPS